MSEPIVRQPELTARQAEVLDFIRSYTEENGRPPCLREIANALGMVSSTAAIAHVRALVRKGRLEEPGMRQGRDLRLKGFKTVLVPV